MVTWECRVGEWFTYVRTFSILYIGCYAPPKLMISQWVEDNTRILLINASPVSMEGGDTAETLNIKVSRPKSTISGVASWGALGWQSCAEMTKLRWNDKVALGRGLEWIEIGALWNHPRGDILIMSDVICSYNRIADISILRQACQWCARAGPHDTTSLVLAITSTSQSWSVRFFLMEISIRFRSKLPSG